MPLRNHLTLALTLKTTLAHAGRKDFSLTSATNPRPILATHLTSLPTYYLSSTPTYPHHLPVHTTYLSSLPTYPHHLPMLTTYLCSPTHSHHLPNRLNPEWPRVRKVRHPVLPGIAGISLRTKCSEHKAPRYTR